MLDPLPDGFCFDGVNFRDEFGDPVKEHPCMSKWVWVWEWERRGVRRSDWLGAACGSMRRSKISLRLSTPLSHTHILSHSLMHACAHFLRFLEEFVAAENETAAEENKAMAAAATHALHVTSVKAFP
jgi:hypothetical protein